MKPNPGRLPPTAIPTTFRPNSPPASSPGRPAAAAFLCNITSRMCLPASPKTNWRPRSWAFPGTARAMDWTERSGAGNFFSLTETACRRMAHFRQFRLPGGGQAVQEPRRAALGMLYEVLGGDALAAEPTACRSSPLPRTNWLVLTGHAEKRRSLAPHLQRRAVVRRGGGVAGAAADRPV